jgi:hypothetical protein
LKHQERGAQLHTLKLSFQCSVGPELYLGEGRPEVWRVKYNEKEASRYSNKTIQKIRKSMKFTTKVKRRKSAPDGEEKKKQ